MGRTLKIVVIVVLVEIVVVAAAFLIGMYSGVYDVAATVPHLGITSWVFSTTMDRSVRHNAAGISVSEDYKNANPAEGYERYHQMCEGCHGGPGIKQGEIGAGLNPLPQWLVDAAPDWTPAEVYWIVKNGVKMTGMPGFGASYDDKKLWSIAAFVKRLPDMTPEQYKEMGKAPEAVEPKKP